MALAKIQMTSAIRPIKNKMKNLYILIILFLLKNISHGQYIITGRVVNEKKEGLFAATIAAPEIGKTFFCDSVGNFNFKIDSLISFVIVAEYNSKTDTFYITLPLNKPLIIKLIGVNSLKSIKIKGDGLNSFILKKGIKTEVITNAELQKAACCDLAGCFGTQGSVKSVTTNAITNAQELRILGLSGVYNQVLTDGLPMIQGLSYTYGISAMPGISIYGIYVTKGANSVLQGYDNMVGQINVVPKNGSQGEKLLINSYLNSFGENHQNILFSTAKKKWTQITSAQLVMPAKEIDRNKDGFNDVTLLHRQLVYSKWQFGQHKLTGLKFTIAAKLNNENRTGGQMGFDPKNQLGSSTTYGQNVALYQTEYYGRADWVFNSNQQLSLINSGIYHNQNSFFGLINYKAEQKQSFTNLQFEQKWNEQAHNLKMGYSLRLLQIDEDILLNATDTFRNYGGHFERKEIVNGIFAENAWNWRGDIYQLITGFRADYHQEFGWHFTPRAMFKYEISNTSIIRASAGTGWRTVNLFAENIGMLISARDIEFRQKLNPEKSVNYGLNYTKDYTLKTVQGYLTVDFYQTRFQNQFFPNYDENAQKIIIENFTGNSVSNGFQADFNSTIKQLLELKFSYNYLDVYRMVNGAKFLLPFNAKNRFMIASSYKTKNKKWQGDANIHIYGKQRLPDTKDNPEIYRQADFSDAYMTINVQLLRKFKKLEIYAGIENLLNYRQPNPIVSAQDPFSPYFDTAFNWGPIRGSEFYMGIRYQPFAK